MWWSIGVLVFKTNRSLDWFTDPSCYDAIKQYVTVAPTVNGALNKTEGDKAANEDGQNM